MNRFKMDRSDVLDIPGWSSKPLCCPATLHLLYPSKRLFIYKKF
jgi:hypothetical protein